MKRLILILFFIPICSFGQTEYLPDIAWSTNIENSTFINTDTFTVDVTPLDLSEPGAFPLQMGNYLVDNRGLRYEIIDTTSYPTITVVDIFQEGFAPFNGKIGYVYQSAGDGNSPSLPTHQFEKLDSKALDYAYRIDNDILWREANLYAQDSASIVWTSNLDYFTNAHEADPLFKNWNKTEGINIWSKQIMDIDSTLEKYALLEDITGGIRDADFTSLAINGIDLAVILNDTADNVRSEIPVYLTDLDSAGFSITESQISDLAHFTTGDEIDPVYVADSLQLKADIQNNADSITAHRTDINTNLSSIQTLQAHTDTTETFTATDNQSVFSLSQNAYENKGYTVSQNGVILPPAAYTISSTTLTLSVNVWANDRININYKFIRP